MGGFTKLFSRILTSSIWSESNEVRIVWITLLAATGPDGIARVTLPGLSRLSNIPLKETEKAIAVLSGPDRYSRTTEHGGRRIKEERDDHGGLLGYFVYNYSKHRAVDATAAERKRRQRAADVTRDRHARQKTEDRSTEEQKTDNGNGPSSADADSLAVFEYWKTKADTEPRSKKVVEAIIKRIRSRIKDGFIVDQLKRVVDVACWDSFYLERGYHKQPAVIFRNAERVNRLLGIEQNEREKLLARCDPYGQYSK